MKKLALGALILAASSTGCIISESTDAVVTARWSFTHFADNSARSCPTDFQTASVYAQPWDPINNRTFGSAIIDKFDCADMSGTTAPLDGIYLVWVQIERDSGTGTPYASSESVYVDTADGDVGLDFEIFDDAGQFYLTWDLVEEGTNRPLTCDQAGVTGDAGVTTAATIVGTSFLLADTFECDHYFGTTDPLLAGTYTVSVEAIVDDESVGTAPALTNKTIRAPNGLTDLGHIMIPIR